MNLKINLPYQIAQSYISFQEEPWNKLKKIFQDKAKNFF
jgi:hypothetical protein